MARPDSFDLLCESCGYDLRALKPTDRCPECGRPVADSIAGSRPRSEWQRRPTPRAYARLVAQVVLHPRRTLGSVVCDPSESPVLMITNAGVVACESYLAMIALLLLSALRGGSGTLEALVIILTFGAMVTVVSLVACFAWLEALGLMARGALHLASRRHVPGLGVAIAGHAGVSLPIGGAAFWVGVLLGACFDDVPAGQAWWAGAFLIVPLTLGASLVLTIVGVRANRFANRPGAHHSLAS